MTDRELLELAAKAAGVFITKEQFEKECTSPWDPEWEPVYDEETGSISGWRTWYGSSGEIGGWEDYTWDPMNRDGEALRLAVKLRMLVDVPSARNVQQVIEVVAAGVRNSIYEPCGADLYAATRRAIVRAVAEIGKAMP